MRRRHLVAGDGWAELLGQRIPWRSRRVELRREERARRKAALLDRVVRDALRGVEDSDEIDPLADVLVYVGYAQVPPHPSAVRRARGISLRQDPSRLP